MIKKLEKLFLLKFRIVCGFFVLWKNYFLKNVSNSFTKKFPCAIIKANICSKTKIPNGN